MTSADWDERYRSADLVWSNLTDGYGDPRDPAVLFTRVGVERNVEGLAVERSERVLRPVLVEGKEVKAIDALVRPRRPT